MGGGARRRPRTRGGRGPGGARGRRCGRFLGGFGSVLGRFGRFQTGFKPAWGVSLRSKAGGLGLLGNRYVWPGWGCAEEPRPTTARHAPRGPLTAPRAHR